MSQFLTPDEVVALTGRKHARLQIANLPPKVKEILEKLSESGAKVEVMKVEVSKF